MGFNKAFEDRKFMIFYVRRLSYLIKGEWKLYPDLEGWTVKEFPKKDREKVIRLSSNYPIYDWIKDDGYNNFKNWVK